MAILSSVLVQLLGKNSYEVTHTVHYILISYFSTSPVMPSCNCTSVDLSDFTDTCLRFIIVNCFIDYGF
jgi:hypothetical protein